MSRAFNFSAGPATLPEAVLRQAQEEMLDFRGAGASIVELSHRGPEFIEVAAEAEADLRRLLRIPDDYAVLFTAGGATTAQALIPLPQSEEGAMEALLTDRLAEAATQPQPVRRQARFPACLCHAFDEVEYIGRTTA